MGGLAVDTASQVEKAEMSLRKRTPGAGGLMDITREPFILKESAKD